MCIKIKTHLLQVLKCPKSQINNYNQHNNPLQSVLWISHLINRPVVMFSATLTHLMNGSIWCFSFAKRVNKAAARNPHWVTVGQQAQQQKHLLLQAAQCGLVCENSQANCVRLCVCACLCVRVCVYVWQQPEPRHRWEEWGLQVSELRTDYTNVIPAWQPGRRPQAQGLDYLTAGQRMRQQGGSTETQQLKSAALLLIPSHVFPMSPQCGEGKTSSKTASYRKSLTSYLTDGFFLQVNLGNLSTSIAGA